MTNLDKVIKAIEICYTPEYNCSECPFFQEDDCDNKMMHDVLTMLKAKKKESIKSIISSALVLALAIIAAVVATGLIAGLSMWPWIIGYWLTLTAKNIVDYIGGRK